MSDIKIKEPADLFKPHQFSVSVESKANQPGAWNSTVVSILDGDVKIGEYTRNYPSHAQDTFCPFVQDGKWYALYSKDYTSTRVMSLPDCKDLGGEDRNAGGFCPAELWVPTYRLGKQDYRMKRGKDGEEWDENDLTMVFWPDLEGQSHSKDGEEGIREWFEAETKEKLTGEPFSWSDYNYHLGPWQSCPFGFVAGCVWGDDHSWKIEYFDLQQAAKGIIKREQRFGYIELARNMKLRQAIDLSNWEPDFNRVQIAHSSWFDLNKKPDLVEKKMG